ncbi:VWA domain-containing protein [Candidatus Pacearchaeota archaeon]|nr:VWA domain-containing protein [Candidatus Pacearchaeota archaeon]
MDKKRGIFFSADALVAVIIIMFVIFVAYPIFKTVKPETELQNDIIVSLSTLKIGDMYASNSYVQALLDSGIIKDTNKPLLEQIGEFYVTNFSMAQKLGEEFLKDLNTKRNIGIFYGGRLIASKNSTSYENASNVEVARQLISGIREGNSTTGFSARAFLAKSLQNKYFYFGGYVGDGNITLRADYKGNITGAELETAINDNFDVYVNGKYAGSFLKSANEFTPQKYSLPTGNFSSGENYIDIFGNNLYIAGGFLKITYASDAEFEQATRYYFPGVDGVVNVYDGFYLPNINTMNILLHFNASHQVFLTIGNITVFNETVAGEATRTVSDAELSSKLDYGSTSGKNVPVRFGIRELVETLGGGNADVILITDYSGSMKKAINDDLSQGNANFDCANLEANPNAQKARLAECLDFLFVDIIMNNNNNRIWPVYLHSDAVGAYTGNASDPVAVKNYIDNNPPGNPKDKTCLACVLNKGYDILKSNTNSSQPARKRFIILMTDGVPTHCASGSCASNSSVYGTKYCDGYCDFQGGQQESCITQGCDDALCDNAVQNTIYSANRSTIDLNAVIYTIGFGLVGTNCNKANSTLTDVATIGNGEYFYSSNVSELKLIYENIAKEILRVSFRDQTANLTGANFFSRLYADSYIEFNYIKEQIPLGVILTLEQNFNDSYHGNFSIPPNSSLVEAKAVSYSGYRWTDYASLNGIKFYNLTEYIKKYLELGDPFVFTLPKNLIQSNNTVRITTGSSPGNTTFGSVSNKIIYTVVKNTTSFATGNESTGGIFAFAEGCEWNVTFEDGITDIIPMPAFYSNGNSCTYDGSDCDADGTPCDINDALQVAANNLLKVLDFDSDGKVDVKFSEQNLQVAGETITGIPFAWSTEVQVIVWD